jgi:D-proline reductase (dithiol) PrdB
VNVAFPLERPREMAGAGEIGSVADLHYSFMGGSTPAALEDKARAMAGHLASDGVDAVLLIPI